MASSTTSRLWSWPWSPSFLGGSTRAKFSIGTIWVVTQQPQHPSHHHHLVFLLGQIHMLRNMFCNTLLGTCFATLYFTEFSESMRNLIADDNVTSQFQELFCSFQLTVKYITKFSGKKQPCCSSFLDSSFSVLSTEVYFFSVWSHLNQCTEDFSGITYQKSGRKLMSQCLIPLWR